MSIPTGRIGQEGWEKICENSASWDVGDFISDLGKSSGLGKLMLSPDCLVLFVCYYTVSY